MEPFFIETERLFIREFAENMSEAVHKNSLDADTREFVPDEVFETVADAQKAVKYLISCYAEADAPKVCPVLLKDNKNIGYVQAVPFHSDEWETGYKIAKPYTGCSYGMEAVKAFLPVIMQKLGITQIWGICRSDNIASARVLEKSGFDFYEEKPVLYHGKPYLIRKFLYKLF